MFRKILSGALALVPSLVCAEELARGQLLLPLGPGMESRLHLSVSGADPQQSVWVSYHVVALSADSSPTGQIDIEGVFEGVKTPINEMMALFGPGAMKVSKGGGSIAQQLESAGQKRSPEEWQKLMGDDMYRAYQAVDAGKGRVLEGKLERTLPLGSSDGSLIISVERAEGIQPLMVMVVAGQGDMPASLQSTAEGNYAYKVGRFVGGALFLYLLYWLFIGRRRS